MLQGQDVESTKVWENTCLRDKTQSWATKTWMPLSCCFCITIHYDTSVAHRSCLWLNESSQEQRGEHQQMSLLNKFSSLDPTACECSEAAFQGTNTSVNRTGTWKMWLDALKNTFSAHTCQARGSITFIRRGGLLFKILGRHWSVSWANVGWMGKWWL